MDKKLLSLCLKDTNVLLRVIDKGITQDFFNVPEQSRLFKIIIWFYKEYSSLLTEDSLKSILSQTNLKDDLKSVIFALYIELNVMQVFEPVDFIIEYLVKEYKTKQLNNLIRDSIDNFTPDRIEDSLSTLVKQCNKISNVCHSSKKEGSYSSNVSDRLSVYQDAKTKPSVGVTYGYKTLDSVTGGHMPGELWVILAGMKVGKTLFMLNIANNVWKQGKNVVYFSAEVSKRVIERRLDAMNSNLSVSALKKGVLNTEAENQYKAYLDSIKNKSGIFYTVDRSGITTDAIRAKIQELKMKFPIDLVVVDYISIIQLAWKESSNWERVGRVALELRDIASTEDVPLLSAHQMNTSDEIAHSQDVGRHLDLMLSLKLKDPDEKLHSPVCTLQALIKLARDAEQKEFDLYVEYDKMLIRDPSDNIVISQGQTNNLLDNI